jgi:hypothetical protein
MKVFAIDPPVVRCSCGDKVVIRKDGDLRRHLATGEGGEFYPWPNLEGDKS